MLEMIVYKSQNGRSLVNQFSNSYLFNGAPNYLSEVALNVLIALAIAESRIFFDTTHFMRGVIRQLDASGRHVDGETRTHAFNYTGATPLPAGAIIVPPNIVVAYEKRVLVGRPGITLYRNAVTSDEYNAYVEYGTVPDRLRYNHAPGDLPAAVFTSALLAAEGTQGLDMMLPINPRYSQGAARSIIGINMAGIRFRQETHQRDSGTENLLEAVQQLINENARAIRRMLTQLEGAAGPILTALTQVVIDLVLAAFFKYGMLTLAQRAFIRWPAIYRAATVLALMPPGTAIPV
jgi:hypothetical protein